MSYSIKYLCEYFYIILKNIIKKFFYSKNQAIVANYCRVRSVYSECG